MRDTAQWAVYSDGQRMLFYSCNRLYNSLLKVIGQTLLFVIKPIQVTVFSEASPLTRMKSLARSAFIDLAL